MSVSERRPSMIVEDALLAIGRTPILTIPSLDGPRQGHWLNYWDDLPNVRRVDLPFHSYPRRDAWLNVLGDAVESAADRVLLVGHGLGCAAVAIWASLSHPVDIGRKIAGALLVSPLDPELDSDPRCSEFRQFPGRPLPFASWIVDADAGRRTGLARRWGCSALDSVDGEQDGPWPEGLRLIASLSRAARLGHAAGTQRMAELA